MRKRIISSLIGLPLLILVVVIGGDVLKACILFLTVVGMFELYRALSKSLRLMHVVGYLFAGAYMFFIDDVTDYKFLAIILILFTLTVLCSLVFFFGTVNIVDACVTVFGFAYVAILLSTVYLVRMLPNGEYYVWLVFISAWGCDTGAIFTGKAFGKHKLVPKLSPKKTVEGAIGGTITATLLSAAYALLLEYFLSSPLDINTVLYFTVAGAVGAVLAQFGDLTASAIKRHTGIKDYGKIIPGHGGVMDRFDSILFTAPAIYLVLLLLSR